MKCLISLMTSHESQELKSLNTSKCFPDTGQSFQIDEVQHQQQQLEDTHITTPGVTSRES